MSLVGNRRLPMRNRVERSALFVLLFAALPGCLYETVIDATGGGTMTVTIRLDKREDLLNVKSQMENRMVKVTSAEFVSDGEPSRGVFKLQFADVTKLSTTSFFKSVSISRSEGVNGAKVLTAVVKNEKATEVPDSVVQRLGKEVKVVVTFPGDVIESNGTVSGGNTVTWTWGMKDFYKLPEVMMTAAYRPPPGTPSTGTTPPAGTPGP